MSEEDTVAVDTITDESQLDTLREGIDDPQVLKAQLAKEAEARRQLTARAIKAETALKEIKNAPKEEVTESHEVNNAPPMEDERLELRLQGYSKEEVSFIMDNGGPKVMDDTKSLTAIAINTRREQLAAEKAAGQTDTSGGEDRLTAVDFKLPKNPSLKDLKESTAKMEQALPHAD